MRLLILGHLSHTGFGTVTHELGERFLSRGIDVRVIAVNYRGEPIRGPLGGRVWPAAIYGEGFGANITAAAIEGGFWTGLDPADRWKPDVLLVISDMTGLMSHIGRMSPAWTSLPVFHYCPMEGDNLPPQWRDIWQPFHPVAMSDYGAKVIGDLLGREIPRIYHGTDTETFHPVSAANPIEYEGKTLRTKEDCRAAFGIAPDAKVVLRTDRNVIRKFYYRFVEAMGMVADQVPDLKVIVHCQPRDGADGLDLFEEMARLPREKWGIFGLTNAHDTFKGLPVEGLVALMNAADLYVSTTGGEGFGLTLAESLACGVPVVVTDWAADAETVGPGGVLVPPLTDRYGEPVRYHSTYGMSWALPDPRGFVEPVVRLLNKPHARRAMGEAGRAHVRRTFDWDDATAQFIDLFASALTSAEVAA